jgi:hypothetical protein
MSDPVPHRDTLWDNFSVHFSIGKPLLRGASQDIFIVEFQSFGLYIFDNIHIIANLNFILYNIPILFMIIFYPPIPPCFSDEDMRDLIYNGVTKIKKIK